MRTDPDSRHLCSQLVAVLCGCGRSVSGNLEEIGELSAMVLTEAPIRRGSQIRIACNTHNLRGMVLSCTFTTLLGYVIEVVLEADSRWSPGWFVPKHMMPLLRRAA
jgi:hypothetical protein